MLEINQLYKNTKKKSTSTYGLISPIKRMNNKSVVPNVKNATGRKKKRTNYKSSLLTSNSRMKLLYVIIGIIRDYKKDLSNLKRFLFCSTSYHSSVDGPVL